MIQVTEKYEKMNFLVFRAVGSLMSLIHVFKQKEP